MARGPYVVQAWLRIIYVYMYTTDFVGLLRDLVAFLV